MRTSTLILLLVLTGCVQSSGDIQTEYRKIARKVGIVPVFPPEQDIQVGDILIRSVGETDDELRVWVGQDDRLIDMSLKHMQSRLVFRPTVEANANLKENAPSQTDLFGTGFRRRHQERIESLPIVGLPAVVADAGSSFGFGRALPTAALGLGLGRTVNVRMNFGDVRTYGVPHVAIYNNKQDILEQTKDQLLGVSKNTITNLIKERYYRERNAGRDILNLGERCNILSIVTRVYLTRKIDFTFFDARAVGLSASSASGGASTITAPNPGPINIAVSTSAAPAPKIDTASLQASVRELATAVRAVTPSSTGNATSLTFEGFNALGATFSQTYQFPVVVGYELISRNFGFTLEETKRCLEKEPE